MLELDLKKYRFEHKWFCNSEIKRELTKYFDSKQLNNILELGSFEGLSGTAFSDNLLDHERSTLDCVDPFILSESGLTPSKKVIASVEENCRFNLVKSKNSNKCTIHKMKSDAFFSRNYRDFNLIYIDGSHEVDDIKHDMVNGFACLRTSGIMWMDDYMGGNTVGEIESAMNSVIDSFGHLCKIIHKGYQIAILKV